MNKLLVISGISLLVFWLLTSCQPQSRQPDKSATLKDSVPAPQPLIYRLEKLVDSLYAPTALLDVPVDLLVEQKLFAADALPEN